MIISPKFVLGMQPPLIENFCEREKNPEGAGFDIRVGQIFEISGEGFLGVQDRKSPDIKKIADVEQDKEFILEPGKYVVVSTMESVNIPGGAIEVFGRQIHVEVEIFPRSTLQRSGVLLRTTKVDPGYHGELTFGMFNAGPCPFRLELGARIANLVFKEMQGELSQEYSGQWKGGRVATGVRERQN